MKKIICLLVFVSSLSLFSQVVEKAEDISPLLIGEKIPSMDLENSAGDKINTDKILNKKTVLIVYRGGWCPFCNTQLSEMQEIENEIQNLGYQIVAVSPDSPSKLNETVGKEKLNYTLFSDSDGAFAKSLGIAFASPEKYSEMLGKYSDGKNKSLLPVPTVYVLDDKGIIKFLYINPNYKDRLKANLLLAVLKNL